MNYLEWIINKKYFFISLLGHIILFVILFFYFIHLSQPPLSFPRRRELILISSQKYEWVPAFAGMTREVAGTTKEVVADTTRKVASTTNKAAGMAREKPLTKTTVSTLLPQPSRDHLTTPAPTSLPVKKNAVSALLTLLHQQIAAKQSYPESALLLHQTGTVRLGFILFPDGHITQISVLKSSGFDSMDSSALAALKEIIPVKEASAYLHQETFFSVDIVFE